MPETEDFFLQALSPSSRMMARFSHIAVEF